MGKFDITEITKTTITTGLAGKIIGIYGTNNTGKSYVSARLFPGKTLWLATEKGIMHKAIFMYMILRIGMTLEMLLISLLPGIKRREKKFVKCMIV